MADARITIRDTEFSMIARATANQVDFRVVMFPQCNAGRLAELLKVVPPEAILVHGTKTTDGIIHLDFNMPK